MGSSLRHIPDQMLESEGDDIHFHENDFEKENQGSGQLDHEPNETSVLDEDINVSKKVHKFYFVKFRPHQDPSSVSKIEKAEKLIRKLNRDKLRVTKRIEEIEPNEIREFHYGISNLWYEDRRLEQTLFWKRCQLKRLQVSLDRICFSNKAYQKPACLLPGNELDNHKLQYQMLHCCKSLAKEKKLIRDIKASISRGEDHTLSLGELDRNFHWRYYENYNAERNTGLANHDHHHDHGRNLEEIKELQLKADKHIYNAAVKGKTWNSLGSKQAIIHELKLTRDDIEVLIKKRAEVRTKTDRIKNKLQTIEKVRDSLYKQLNDMHQRKKESCESILKLRKQFGEENACYYQNRFLLRKALALASKKDVAALEKLSCTEVEEFMFQWNKIEAFRDDYKKRVSPSLCGRQLSLDGRMRSLGHDEDPHILVTPTFVKREAAFTRKELKCLMKDVKAKASCWYGCPEHI